MRGKGGRTHLAANRRSSSRRSRAERWRDGVRGGENMEKKWEGAYRE